MIYFYFIMKNKINIVFLRVMRSHSKKDPTENITPCDIVWYNGTLHEYATEILALENMCGPQFRMVK